MFPTNKKNEKNKACAGVFHVVLSGRVSRCAATDDVLKKLRWESAKTETERPKSAGILSFSY
jgi:dTDP-4-dehydrorhamnose reductase